MQGRSAIPTRCPCCDREVRHTGAFCPGCGARLRHVQRRPDPEEPKYRKTARRAVGAARCGGFHHELLVHVFHYRFCPECGFGLRGAHAGAAPEPA